jgi:polar amino acid transport system substrate-binding protein
MAFDGVSLREIEWSVAAKDGSAKILCEPSTARFEYSGDGEIMGLVIEMLDVTELREAERRERLQREHLYQTAKLVSLGTLLSGVAHEINNPNNFIRMSVDNLEVLWSDVQAILDRLHTDSENVTLGGLSYDKSRDMAKTMLEAIREGSERIAKLVSDLRDFARKRDARDYELVDLNDVLEASINLIRGTLNKATSRFTFQPPKRQTTIRCNRQQIGQVVVNLLTNACQALESRDEGISVRVRKGAGGAWVELVVSDEGRGIPAEEIHRVTDPFYTTKLSESGTGLGLAVSHRIASDHGGTLEFASREGAGTTVTLRLPVQRKDNEHAIL